MPDVLSKVAPKNNALKIARVGLYIDSVEISTVKWPHADLMSIVQANSGSLIPGAIQDRVNPKIVRRHLLKINQPSRLCIETLQRYKAYDPKLSIYRFHLAMDVISIYDGITREEVIEVFATLFHLRYRRGSDELHDEDGTIYSVRVKGRKSRPYRNTAYYTTRPSKITGEIDAIHFEIRLERKRSVQAAGINDPADILSIDWNEFVAKYLATKDIRAILEKITRRGIRLTCADYPDEDPAYIERRVRGLNRRLGLQHASIFPRYHPKQFERVKHWDCLDIEQDRNWASADVRCDDKVGELRCLLPPSKSVKAMGPIIRERL
ncbi:hypothetical protein [Bradyrhizobium canariense]|uniref:Replication-associated protein G2P N-terminal domain-containing protein n=1 Tax=Bradyrhizobium canariense TaxID=255045 RepID=A0A1X3GYC1_9BRAD|nr:hypothetical protein [Bradyrhizobium canariense]OSI65448.1 hypothetical protein BSZ22_31635 [Bradyrhizobium canariense]OSI75770.1 hypothetical protein BSZ23_27005 [Bradyrhizobium canariense]OSI85526.1 hypothetical protein BSZ24_31135 [Bradyrhizobium canariense]OSI87107.1 hypothetical protein BSZ25_28565 [Bradyrhizobium canariense]OSI99547.1 hypothetical protein BSZ16_29615 [Bradyrhizobium canariense]